MKRLISTLAIALCALSAAAQQQFDISGKAPQGATRVKLIYTTQPADSADISQGHFSLKGLFKAPLTAYLLFDDQRQSRLPVILTTQPLVFDIEQQTVSGSADNERLLSIHRQIGLMTAPLDSLAKQYEAVAGDKAAQEAISNEYTRLSDRLTDYKKQIIRDEKDGLIPAFYLHEVLNALTDDELFALADPTLPYMQDPGMQRYHQYVNTKKNIAIGRPFVDFTMPTPDGQAVKLSDYAGRGRYVLVDFWASWCGPCRADMPHIVGLYETYKDKGLEIVGVSFDTKADAWTQAITRLGMSWPQLSDLQGWKSLAARLYAIRYIPATVLIAPDGTIIAHNLRGEALDRKLAEIFNGR